MSKLKSVGGYIERRLSLPRLNIFKTFYFNIRTLPLKEALRFPIFIYGRCQFAMLNGKVSFVNTKIYPGLVKIGRNTDLFFANRRTFFFLTKGTQIVFEGPSTFGTGCSFRLSGHATLTFGKYTRSGSGVGFLCENSVYIGMYSTFAFCCQVMDTSYHYILDTDHSIVKQKSKPIRIGAYNWVGNKSCIMKGTVTGDGFIVTSGSLLNKNYLTLFKKENIIIGGAPAKLIAEGFKRIFSFGKEAEITSFFENSGADFYEWSEEMEDDLNLKGVF